MPIDQFILLCLYVTALVGTPGPANLALLACGANFGARTTLPFLFGTLAGFHMIYVLTAAGLLALVTGVPLLWTVLRIACVGYILYLAYTIATARPHERSSASKAPGFWRGFWIHPLNPKAYAMQVAGISQFVSPERYVGDAIILALTFLLLGGALNFGWACGGNLLSGLARNPMHFRVANVSLAILMVASTLASLHLT